MSDEYDFIHVRDAFVQAKEDYLRENPPEEIKKKMYKEIKASEQEILRKVLGFDTDSWGNKIWKLDHCNGRSGNSFIGSILEQIAREAVNKWITDKMELVLTKNMEKDMEKYIENKVGHYLKRGFDYSIRKMIDDKIEKEVNEQMRNIDQVLEEMVKA